jgi:hypothetical protein
MHTINRSVYISTLKRFTAFLIDRLGNIGFFFIYTQNKILWRAIYTPSDRQTSRVYSTTLVQCLYISCYLSSNKPVLLYPLLRLLPQRWPDQVVPLVLYTVLLYTHTHTLAAISTSHSLFRIRKCYFGLKFCSVHFIGYNFYSTFRLRFC